MSLSTIEREEVATELKRFASDLNLTDDQKEKLRVALTEAAIPPPRGAKTSRARRPVAKLRTDLTAASFLIPRRGP
jgi:hypothetical protein